LLAFFAKANGDALGVEVEFWRVVISIEQMHLLRLKLGQKRVVGEFFGRLGTKLQL
jgi:hypothetical protein